MKYLPWMSVTLVVAQSLMGCGSSDETPLPGAAGAGGSSAGAPTTGGTAAGGGGTGNAGAPTTGGAGAATGGTSAGGSGGAPATGGGGAGGTAGTGGSAALKDIVDTAVAAGSFTKLADALTAADLVTALKGAGPFTVFAPTDAAFAAFETANPGELAKLTKDQLAAILKYHVLSGAAVASSALKDDQVVATLNGSPLLIDLTGGVKVGGSNVTMPDVKASNGVIHVIDKIIIPPADDIVVTATKNPAFSKLVAALGSAQLVETLKGPGPFTVFAPNDAAFDKLGTAPTGQGLKDVLLYHVVPSYVGSGDLVAGKVNTALTGKSVDVTLTGGVTINTSKVTMANIITKNGVIHVVDTVLIPPQ